MVTFNRRSFLTGAVSLAGVTTLSHSRLLAAAAAVGEPRLKFGVLSDVHLYEPGDEGTFVKALEYFRDHGADGVLIAGDIAHTGGYGQLKRCADAWNKVFPGDKAPDGRHVEKLFIYGNHDIECLNWDKRPANDPEFEADSAIGKGQNRVRMWEKAFGEKYEPIWMKQVKGYTFIGAHWDKSDHTEIEAFMAAHGKEIDPKKPFFYTQHAHPKDTCFGSWAWGRDNGAATRAFAKFPNAVTFTGHSHYTLTDERTVWQGAFTSINTASLMYVSTDYSLRENVVGNGYGYRGEKRPRRMKDVGTYNGRQGMLVSVFDDCLVIERREFVHGQSLGDDWVVPMPAADGAYSYEKRAARRTAPEFAAGAKVAVKVTPKADEKDFTHVTLAFPAAEMRQKCRVFEYEATAVLCEDEVELVQAQRRMMAPDFHLPVSQLVKEVEFTFAAEDLPLKGHYRFEVRPVECFGKRGAAIASDVVEVL